MKAAFLAAAVLATAGVVFYFGTAIHAAKASGPGSAEQRSAAHNALSSKSLSLPLFFEPNQGQTAPQVKFLARGAGYGLFLTADEAVLQLQPSAVSRQHSDLSSQLAAHSSQPTFSSLIRMRLEGANASAHISGALPLPGKSSYFIGNDPSKWHHDIPQFARVQYQAVYPGVDLVYYGDQGQLEYDFRVAPGAEPNQIALSFTGASARIDSGDSGDLILSAANGDVRFHAPHVYQPATPESGNLSGNAEKAIAGRFRQLADNKIGFAIGDYDHSRELIIDPVLSYSTYLGGSGTEALVKVAIDGNGGIYVAGSTNSVDFPLSPPGNSSLTGAQNIFISKINTSLTGVAQLAYSIYLGGSKMDFLAGIAVDSSYDIYVAGWTTSSDFPTTSNAFQPSASGTHGFLSKISFSGTAYSLADGYSTYLAGNGADTVTGLAIDNTGDAFVTGFTTSTNDQSNGFPANPNGFQTVSHAPNQFFASKINTKVTGSQSMFYSTYFGGGNPQSGQTQGGGIAVDTAGNMYITGGTNFLPVDAGSNVRFPLYNAEQSCLDEAGMTSCTLTNPTALDAFVAKINPNASGSVPVYSTYLGGGGDDIGYGIAVDGSGNTYITGSTDSTDFIPAAFVGTSFQQCLNNTLYNGGNTPPCPPSSAQDAFLAKIDNPGVGGSVYQLNYVTYIGGSGDDIGQAIQVDSVQGAHVVGSTTSPDLLLTQDALQPYGGDGDAFVALVLTSESGRGVGDYLTYLGGSQLDQGTGIAVDIYGTTYVAGITQSSDFPVTPATAYQPHLDGQPGGPADAFVSKIGASSTLSLTVPTSSPAPNPVPAGTQVAFTFDITNQGPDTASLLTFTATVPTTGVSTATAKVTSGSGNCTSQLQGTILCFIPNLAVCSTTSCTSAAVEVDLTPTIPVLNPQISVSGSATANNGGVVVGPVAQTVNVTDFGISPAPASLAINAGDTATIQVTVCPLNTQLGYSATVTPSQTTAPSMVTATTPTFNPTTVVLSGSACGTTALSIATLPRPVTTGSLLRRGSFYAAWLPIGGLSLVGLGIGAGRKRRRWLAGAVLCLIAGVILLQSGCGSSSSSPTTPGGTAAGTYIITITGSAGTGSSHNTQVQLVVH